MKRQPSATLQAEGSDRLIYSVWRELLRGAGRQPWLMRLLRERGQAIFIRFAEHYRRLLALSQARRRSLARTCGTGLAGAALLLALSVAPALADTITVDGTCTLVDAITAANTNATVNNCVHSGATGADTIQLQVDTDLTAINNGVNGLPVVTSEITIEGNGNAIRRVSGGDYRLFEINGSGNLTVNNSTVSGGRTDNGGAFYNEGHLTITASTISGNVANTYGGAIYNNGAVTVTNSFFFGNNAGDDGGALYSTNQLYVTNSTFSTNTASNAGGAIFTQSGVATITTSTFSGNIADNGGGLLNSGATMGIYHSTFTGNQAYGASYGAGGVSQSGGALTLRNTIISGNTAPINEEIEYYDGTINSLGFNLLGNSAHTNTEAFGEATPRWLNDNDIVATQSGTNVALASILNTTLADNGGPALTHALVSGSPAIDAIPTGSLRSGAAQPATCTTSTSYDQRGVLRANNGTTGTACDIGSFEYGQAPTAVTIAGFSSQTAWGSGPQLLWETGNESGLSGFHIWRGTAAAAETRLTDALIGATGGLNGGEYTWQDSVTFTWGQRTYYWLEAVHADGGSSFSGPVEVLGIGRLFLPAVGR